MLKVAHISDWHVSRESFPRELELAEKELDGNEPDFLLITGDMIRNWNYKGRFNEGDKQRKLWEEMVDGFENRFPYAEILAIRGNHDYCDLASPGIIAFDEPEGKTVKIGKHVISGFRGVPFHYGTWNDEYNERALEVLCGRVPPETTILLTHAPPYGVLDAVNERVETETFVCEARRIGSVAIEELVHNSLPNLKAHCFGHVHEQGGKSFTNRGVRYSNAACTLNYFELDD